MEQLKTEQEETGLFCEYCGGRFLLTRHGVGGTFNCFECEQFHDFSDQYGLELYHTSGPARRIFPEKMNRGVEVEFVNWQRKTFLLDQAMYLMLEQISQSEHDERVKQCEVDVAAHLQALNLSPPGFWGRVRVWWNNAEFRGD